jgi:hypothetical protein
VRFFGETTTNTRLEERIVHFSLYSSANDLVVSKNAQSLFAPSHSVEINGIVGHADDAMLDA